MTVHLALCVDDYGLHAGVDAAVLELQAAGRLGAVSCMVAGERWRSAGPALRGIDPFSTDVGLHLDLTEHPFDPALRHRLPMWIATAWARIVPAKRLRAEILAQLEAFETVLGRAPAHVDGHQHVHQFPVVRDLLVEILCQRYPASGRPWVRSTEPPSAARGKARMIHRLGGAAFGRQARHHGLATNGRLLGVYDFTPDAAAYRIWLAGWLAQARDLDLLMCHPSRAASVSSDPILAARRIEADVLCAPEFARMLQAADVTLAPLHAHPGWRGPQPPDTLR